jgi:hypothetical protein
MSPQELFDEAIRLEDEGQQELALGVWRRLTETHPTRNAFLRLAGLTKELGFLDDAERAFKRALEIDDRSALALRALGILAIRRRDYEIAETYPTCRFLWHPTVVDVATAQISVRAHTLERLLILEDQWHREVHPPSRIPTSRGRR